MDSGVEPAHPNKMMIHGYRDFVDNSEEWKDNSGHGSTGVDLVCKVVKMPEIYVARVFETSSGSVDVQDRITEVSSLHQHSHRDKN